MELSNEEREALIRERDELIEKFKTSPFISPKDMRRKEAIDSLLISNGQFEDIKLIVGKPRKSHRVTSFTRDRR